MTADEYLQERFRSRPRACPACGLIDDVRVVIEPTYCRWQAVACRCGAVVARITAPFAVVPFGMNQGEYVHDLAARDAEWIHDMASHPWFIVAACRRVHPGKPICAPSYAEWKAGFVPPSRAELKARRQAYVKARAEQIRRSIQPRPAPPPEMEEM